MIGIYQSRAVRLLKARSRAHPKQSKARQASAENGISR